MNVKMAIGENQSGEKGLIFLNSQGKDLYWIPNRHLYMLDEKYQVLEGKVHGTVLTQLIRVANHTWATSDLINELAKYMHNNQPELDADIIADTFIAIAEISHIHTLANEFKRNNPSENWDKLKPKFLKHLKDKGVINA